MPQYSDFIQALKRKDIKKQKHILSLYMDYPEAFKYLVIYPFLTSKVQPSSYADSINRKIKYFEKIRDFLDERNSLDAFGEFSYYLFSHYQNNMTSFTNANLENLLYKLI